MILTALSVAFAAWSGISTGAWRATLTSPTGALPFGMSIEPRGDTFAATITNGEETIERPLSITAAGAVRIEFPHYDSVISAQLGEDGASLTGTWDKIGAGSRVQSMEFRAHAGALPRFDLAADARLTPDDVAGRWTMRFEGEEDPAVLVLRADGTRVLGTAVTQTGDHRFLEGVFQTNRLRLSCFDGAHAFLYDARLDGDALVGTFASGAKWQQKWTARRSDDARIGDEFGRAQWASEPGLLWIEGIDVDGHTRSLGELAFGARALIVQIAGSWCPNCHDELAWLTPLARELEPQGLRVVTIGFELTGDQERDLRQLDRMRTRHGAEHTFLLSGTADKARTAAALGAIDRIVAFPTLAILGADGGVRAVHSGFRGPATGAEHDETTRELRKRIDAVMAEAEAPSAALEMLVAESLWRDERDRTFVEVRREGDRVTFVEREMFRFDGPTREEPVAEGTVTAHGDVLKIGDEMWQFDRRAGVALDPRDLSHRLTAAARGPFPRVGDGRTRGESVDAPEALLATLTSTDAVLRREGVWYLANQIGIAMFAPPDHAPNVDAASATHFLPRLDDADPLVRATACWAVGALRVDGGTDTLRENVTHPFPAVRREATRALKVLEQR